jgi:hypothetical protein
MRVMKTLGPLMCLSAAACQTTAPAPVAPSAPAEIQAPPGADPVLRLSARGTQNYRCQVSAAGAAEWKLVAPEAELFASAEPGGQVAGSHGAGPSWTLSDGSGVIGDASKAKKAPSPESGSILWLLVPVKSNGQPGKLQDVVWIQRLDTHGGSAPETGCDAGSVGAEVKVPYTATYVFYRQR